MSHGLFNSFGMGDDADDDGACAALPRVHAPLPPPTTSPMGAVSPTAFSFGSAVLRDS